MLRLRNEQRLEIDEWRREKKSRQEEERKRVRLEDSETPEEMDRWLTEWKKQRKVIEEKIDRWKVNSLFFFIPSSFKVCLPKKKKTKKKYL